MTRIFEDVFYYRNPLDANCVVFVFKDGPDLDFIDTGIAKLGLVRRVWRDMHRDGLDPRNIRKIYHAHWHFDHVQSDCFFQQRAIRHRGNIPVYAPKADLYRTAPSYRLMDINYWELKNHFPDNPPSALLNMIHPLRYTLDPILKAQIPENVQPLTHGQKITLGKREGIVYTTGGHTEGHSFFHIPDENNILVTSDHDALNEYICNWGRTLDAVRLAEKLNPDNVFVGHNPPRLGHQRAHQFISSYMIQFEEFFGPIVKSFRQGQIINMTRIVTKKMGWIQIIKPAVMWAHMGLFAIGKYFEEMQLGRLSISPNQELLFTITGVPEQFDLIRLIKTGKK